ncbi:MAG: hypothetical protein NT159_15390 [Proteobacteria bacterium]|nr:hypothetical protein [Pseudomonadota bacterium]
MNSFPAINKLTKSLAGVLAMLATVVVLGAPLTLAEYYAHTGSIEYIAANTLAGQAVSALPRNS